MPSALISSKIYSNPSLCSTPASLYSSGIYFDIRIKITTVHPCAKMPGEIIQATNIPVPKNLTVDLKNMLHRNCF